MSRRAESPSRAVAAQGRLGQHTHTLTHTQPERALAANRQHGAGALARARAAAAARDLLRLTEPRPAAGGEDRAGPSPPALRLPARPARPHPYAAQSPPLRRADPEGSRLAAEGDGGERVRRRERAAGIRGRQTLLLAALPRPRSLTSPPSPDPAHVHPSSKPPPDPPRRLDSDPGKTSKRRIVGSLPTSRLGISD